MRRGLFGAIYLAVFPQGQAGLWVLFALQVLLYAIPILYALAWLTRSGYSWLGVALVCGPAAFAFVGWDTDGFARKESLGLTALTLIAIAASPARKPVLRQALVVGGLAVYAVAVFTWEGNALLLPGVLFLVLSAFGGWAAGWTGRAYALVAAVMAIGGLGLTAFYPGTSDTGAMVCSALQGKGLSSRLCGGPFGGAIGYLGKTPDQMIVTVGQSFPLLGLPARARARAGADRHHHVGTAALALGADVRPRHRPVVRDRGRLRTLDHAARPRTAHLPHGDRGDADQLDRLERHGFRAVRHAVGHPALDVHDGQAVLAVARRREGDHLLPHHQRPPLVAGRQKLGEVLAGCGTLACLAPHRY